MSFIITVVHDRKEYSYYVEHTILDQRTEHFKLIAKNKSTLIESNRPLFRNKGLRHHRYELKIIEGEVWKTAFLQRIYMQIEKLVEMYLEQN
jgi:hypothetical protein